MDTIVRGSIEKQVDRLLSQHVLDNANKMFSTVFSPVTKNIDDALLGYVIGRTIEFALFSIQTLYQRMPTDDEFNEIARITERRALEIRSKITLIRNK